MSRCIWVRAAIATLLFSSVAAAADPILNIGDPAPAMTVSTWLKGDKVRQFDPDKIYVVEFWATWCGPCRASIPHLTELAHQYKDKVQFVGVDVWEDDAKAAKPFVDEMGDKMDYAVAVDIMAAPAAADDNKAADDSARGAMAKFWLKAADENGIPTAFVVKEGKIAWIGHPMELEEPLKKILAGQWNLADMAKKRLLDRENQKKLEAVMEKISTPLRAKNYKAALDAINEVLRDSPELADELAGSKLTALCNSGDAEAGVELGGKVMEKYNDNPAALNYYFWQTIDPALVDKVDPRVAQMALKATKHAVELTKEEEPSILNSLAEAQFRTGDTPAAIAAQEKAIEVAKSKGKDYPSSFLSQLKTHLSRYQKAAQEKPEGGDKPDKAEKTDKT